jgi:hypothetical protein
VFHRAVWKSGSRRMKRKLSSPTNARWAGPLVW